MTTVGGIAGGDGKSYACLVAPFPPSTNNLFVNRSRGRFPSDAYKAWRAEADIAFIQQKPLTEFYDKTEITLSFGRPDRRKHDLDNLAKAILDHLVSWGVINDDSLIEKLTLQWAPDVTGCRIEIESIAA